MDSEMNTLTITTTQGSNGKGAGTVTAKGRGRQRTIQIDHSRTPDVNAAAAVGALLAVIATPEERAKVLHPSGGQRVRYEFASEFGGKLRWSIAL